MVFTIPNNAEKFVFLRKINNPWYNIGTAREAKRKARAHLLELGNLARAHLLGTKG